MHSKATHQIFVVDKYFHKAEAGKKRLAGDTARQATTNEVRDLKREARDLKELVAELSLENRLLKKSMIGDGGDEE
jgi:transposase